MSPREDSGIVQGPGDGCGVRLGFGSEHGVDAAIGIEQSSFHLVDYFSRTVQPYRRGAMTGPRAYRLRLAFQDIYEQPSPGWGELILDRWYSWAIRSRLEPMKNAARTVMRHRDGILRWFTSKIANGLIEGINSLVQAAKAKARGYRSTRTIKAITYLIAGKLDLRLPT